jgi:hypothetical protein
MINIVWSFNELSLILFKCKFSVLNLIVSYFIFKEGDFQTKKHRFDFYHNFFNIATLHCNFCLILAFMKNYDKYFRFFKEC